MVIPHPAMGDGAVLPRPLPAAVARLLRMAFKDPAAPLPELGDEPLVGHVLSARFLLPGARPGMDEMQSWLGRFGEQPDAPSVHTLLLGRLPRGAVPPAAPVLPAFAAALPGDDVEVAGPSLPRNPVLDFTVRAAARAGQFDRAVSLIRRTRGLSPEYGALLRAEVAQGLFGLGRDAEALRLAEAANAQAAGQVGLAAWVAGLAAWRLDRPEVARGFFELAYRAPIQSPGRRAGAAFWAARTVLVTRGDNAVWLRRAAAENRTFYGLLAGRLLRERIAAAPPAATIGAADIEAVAATARGNRAFGLLQVGQPGRAAAELRLLFAETREQPGYGRSVMLVAREAGLAELAGQLEAILEPGALRLPANRLRPAGGFRFEPALVYALARLESNFDAAAVSPAGARGLMQLMPGAVEVALAAGRGGAIHIHDPAVNLDLGQRYLQQLMGYGLVGTDLIRLLTAYNAGPGNLARWTEATREEDPLLFLEMLPLGETRAYVPKALSYAWLYAAQMGVPSRSLDELAVGDWPRAALVRKGDLAGRMR